MHRRSPLRLTLSLALLLALPLPVAAMVQIGQVAPDFELTDFNGSPHKLSDYRGKVVVLAFVGYG